MATKDELKSVFQTNDIPTQDNFSNLIDSTANGENIVIVQSLDDLPSASSGVITLADSTIYRFSGSVDIGANRFELGVNTKIEGTHPALDTIVSTTSSALFTSSQSNRLDNISTLVSNGSVFNLTGSGTKNMLINFMVIKACDSIGTVNSMNLFSLNNSLVGSTVSGGLTFSGSNSLMRITSGTYNCQAGVLFELGAAMFDTIYIQNVQIKNDSGVVGISLSSGATNLNSGGLGTISGCFFESPDDAITGYNNRVIEWDVRDNGQGLISSDRFEPTGWAVYGDDASSSIVADSDTLITINGSGSTIEAYLPQSIRNVGSFWDATTNRLSPIGVGDSYTIRLSLTLTASSSNPTRITLEADIGSGASPSIVIFSDSKTLKNGYPQTHMFSTTIYSLGTFVANGGQFFLSANSGTVTIGDRNILISRTSSGAS